MNIKEINKIAADKVVHHFNQEGIAILAVIGLNVKNEAKGAFTILVPGSDPSKIKQILTDLLEECEINAPKHWISKI